MALMMGAWYPSSALATCNVTSDGKGSVGRVTKFTPSSCNIENSVVFESSGKVGIGGPPSGTFEFQVSSPNQIGLLVEGPASGVGAGLDLETTGSGRLQWEILDTGAAAAQGPDKLNIRDINTGQDVFTIRSRDGAIGVNSTNPGAFQLEVVSAGSNGGILASSTAALTAAISAQNTAGPAILAQNNSPNTTFSVQNSTTLITGGLADFSAPNAPELIPGSENGCAIDNGGNLTCTGTITGNTSIASASPVGSRANRLASSARPSAQYVSLHSETSDQWWEDVGSGRLVSGVAKVTLDPAFARTLSTATTYHVFFTPKADCKGLYVARETSTGFEVHELGGGRSSVEFDYWVVARRNNSPIPAPANANLANVAVGDRPTS